MLDYVFMLLFCSGDPESYKLVDQLNDNHFIIREQAHKQLSSMGHKSIRAIEQGCGNCNPEVRYRCERLYTEFYSICPRKGSVPPIYSLSGPLTRYYESQPTRLDYENYETFVGDWDSWYWGRRKHCHQPDKVFALLAHWYYSRQTKKECCSTWLYRYERECAATTLMCQDLLFLGVSRDKIQDLLESMQSRWNPVPSAMYTPPKWLEHWATSVNGE